MKKLLIMCLTILFLAFGVSGAFATSVLCDWAFNVDGTTYENMLGDSMPTTGSLNTEGLGTLTWSTSDVGSHSFLAFFDHEIDESINTFFNEYGDTSGTPSSGQSWEIDEPGWVFGDIYTNVLGGTLDNTNAIPQGSEDDVSMAIGWNYNLSSDETATISLILSDVAPTSGFYLSQTDPETGVGTSDYSPEQTIYFSSTLDVSGGPAPVPEPCTILLVGTGLIGIFGLGRKKLLGK